MLRLSTLALLACSTPLLAQEINVYSHRQPELIQPLVDAFTAETGIAVNVAFVDKGMAERLQAEGRRSPADLVLTVDIARRAAAHSVRGETRALMSELLTRASLPAITAFMADGQRWGQSGEHLMDHSEAVVRLIDHAYPVPIWTELEGVDPTRAADEAFWVGWVDAWHDEFDAAAARATGPSDTQHEASTLRRWAPWLASAAAIISATTVIVAANRA
jgi:hypothetical protein